MFPIAFLTYMFIFIFGLFIGSFLNVVIFRLHSGEPIVFGRSHCMKCKKELSWYELVPVVSFAAQKGKCRHCGAALSFQYPLVELFTGALFLLSFVSLQNITYFSSALYPIPYTLYPIFLWAICSLCIVIGIYDFRYLLIPDAVIIWGSAIALLAAILGIWRAPIFSPFMQTPPANTFAYAGLLVFTAILCALPFFLIVFFSGGKWMGLGDAKLAFFMGMVLGLHAFLAIFVAVISGAIIGLGLMGIGKAQMKTHIPFGPFLVFGMLVMLFGGQAILNYTGGYMWSPF